MKRSMIAKFAFLTLALGVATGCQKETSTSTGWDYNNVQNGGFEKANFEEQRTGPGLVMIEGGTFTMGRTEEDVFEDNDNRPNRFTVSSFYMDRTEVTNFHWLEYVYWMKRVYNKTYPHIYKKSLPDTNCWRDPLSYREKFVEYYFRYPAYRDYPVVGVSWVQANDFCKWRTDRVNEYILVEQGIIKWHFADPGEGTDFGDLGAMGVTRKADARNKLVNVPENMFSTETYLAGQYDVQSGKSKSNPKKNNDEPDSYSGYTLGDNSGLRLSGGDKNKYGASGNPPRDPYQLNDYDPVFATSPADGDASGPFYQGKRNVRMEDGILLPNYRLPTEAEWEYAATGLLGNLDANSENVDERRIYPWDGHYVRYDEEQFQGTIQANFVRGTGDHMGVAGALNDGADATTHVDAYWPNDFGLYNMAGNVSEWVLDTYRPSTSDMADGFMPFRGNVYQTKLMVPNGLHDKYVKSKDNMYDVYGMKEYVNEFARVLYLSATQNALHPDTSFSQQIKKQQDNRSFQQPKVSINVSPEGVNNSLLTIVDEDIIYVALGDSLVFSNPNLLANHLKFGFKADSKTKKLDAKTLTSNSWNFSAGPSNGFVPDPNDINLKRGLITSAAGGAAQGGGGAPAAGGVNFMDTKQFPNYGDSAICVKLNTVGTTILEYKFGNEPPVRKEIRVVGSKDEFDALRANGYTKSISSKVTSRQDARRYQFNSLSKGYIANNKTYSQMDAARFKILDDINALLDTAIYLQNQDKVMEASAYLEKVLFGGVSSTINITDYRKHPYYAGQFNTFQTATGTIEVNNIKYNVDINNIGVMDEIGVYYFTNRLTTTPLSADLTCGSIFGGKAPAAKAKLTASTDSTYLQVMLPGFETDPNIATWIMTLRNGLSEHTIESRGKQRWRNVTEEENIGRLNYRKDDYIDYLDGDLESSIFYNNQKRINDINAGRLSAKNTVYQSEHENRDLEGNMLSPSSSGWPTTLISDKSKVYKGGSWADRAYWLSAGNRRFLDQDKTSATIGFRCAMDRLGDQRNMNYKKRRRR